MRGGLSVNERTPVTKRYALILGATMMLLMLVWATPASAKTVIRAKVKTASAKMYKSYKSTKNYTTLKKGTVVTVISEKGKWVKAKTKSKTGYILKSKLTKLTSKSSGAKAVSSAKSAKKARKTKLRTLKPGKSGSAVKKVQSRLSAKGYLKSSSVNGKYGANTAKAVRKFQMVSGISASGKATVATQKKLFSSSARSKPKVSIEPWGSCDINSRFSNRSCATIIDLKTGTRINIRRLYGTNHCDVEPRTKADTKKLKAIYGGKWSWNSRGVLLIAGGKCYAAAINSMPHGGQISHSNGYPGQFCLHLNDSKTHGSDKENAAHQANIRKVYNYFS